MRENNVLGCSTDFFIFFNKTGITYIETVIRSKKLFVNKIYIKDCKLIQMKLFNNNFNTLQRTSVVSNNLFSKLISYSRHNVKSNTKCFLMRGFILMI